MENQMEEYLRQMSEQMAIQQREMAEQRARINRQEEELARMRKQQPQVPPATEITIKRPKERLPTLREFGGKRTEWDEWELVARNKLYADGEAIGSGYDQFLYIFSRLTGDAARAARAWANEGTERGTASGYDFLSYLASIYSDPNKEARALESLYSMRQGDRETFANFLPKFETTLSNAGGSEFSEKQKINYLRNALNREMRQLLISETGTGVTYPAFVSRLHQIGSNLAAFKAQSGAPARTGLYHRQDSAGAGQMEWEATGPARTNQTTTTGAPRAKWVDKKTLDSRRERGCCLRCGRDNHYVRQCRFLPATRPATLNTVALQGEDSGAAEDVSEKE